MKLVYEAGDLCPKCLMSGEQKKKKLKNIGRLRKKKGEYGIFLGCSKYPGCKFTAKEDKR